MKHLPPRTQGLIAINFAAVIFGSAALYGKLPVSPFWIVAMRACFGALTLLVIGIFRKDISIPLRQFKFTFVLTGAILAIHWLTFFASVQLAGVAVATLTFATFPLFTVLIEALHQKRRPHLAEIVSAMTIIVAIGLLVSPRGGPGSLAGTAIGLTSGLSYALFWHGSKRLSATLPPRDVSFWQNVAVVTFLAPFLPFASPAPFVPLEWLWLMLLGIVNTALMLQLYLYALKRISASTCSGFVALEPVYAILLAALFFHEPMTKWVVICGLMIICASFVLLKMESRP